MTDTDRMVVWLRETLDAAEGAATKAAALCGCHPPAPHWSFRDGDGPTDGRILVVDEPHPGLKRKIGRRWNGSYDGLFMAEHIVLHDPNSVLQRITAERKLLDLHQDDDGKCTECGQGYELMDWGPDFPCATVHLLAEGWGWTEKTN